MQPPHRSFSLTSVTEQPLGMAAQFHTTQDRQVPGQTFFLGHIQAQLCFPAAVVGSALMHSRFPKASPQVRWGSATEAPAVSPVLTAQPCLLQWSQAAAKKAPSPGIIDTGNKMSGHPGYEDPEHAEHQNFTVDRQTNY